jgi:hypothetical protein
MSSVGSTEAQRVNCVAIGRLPSLKEDAQGVSVSGAVSTAAVPVLSLIGGFPGTFRERPLAAFTSIVSLAARPATDGSPDPLGAGAFRQAMLSSVWTIALSVAALT